MAALGRGAQPGELPGSLAGPWAAENPTAAPPQPGQVSCLQSCSALHHDQQRPSANPELLFHLRALGRHGEKWGDPRSAPGCSRDGHDCEKAEITPPLPQPMPASLVALPVISGHLQNPTRSLLRQNLCSRQMLQVENCPLSRRWGKNLSLAKECFSWGQVLNFLIFHVFGFILPLQSRDHPQPRLPSHAAGGWGGRPRGRLRGRTEAAGAPRGIWEA